MQGHTGVVTAVDGVYVPAEGGSISENPHTLLASASVDSSVKIWQRKEGEDAFHLLQTMSFGNGFALDVALGHISVINGKDVFSAFCICIVFAVFCK